jgi:hypothetical protein
MSPDQLSDTMRALWILTAQAKRLDENHPGFVVDFALQQLAFTSTQKAKEMNASSLTSTLTSLAGLGFLPSSEDWAVYADCIQSLSGTLQGRSDCSSNWVLYSSVHSPRADFSPSPNAAATSHLNPKP